MLKQSGSRLPQSSKWPVSPAPSLALFPPVFLGQLWVCSNHKYTVPRRKKTQHQKQRRKRVRKRRRSCLRARVSCVFPCKPSNELRETNKPERRRLFFSYSTFSFRTRFRLVEVFLGGVFFCETWWGVSETENFVDGRRFFFLFFRLRWFERVYLPSLGMVLLFWFFVRGHQS